MLKTLLCDKNNHFLVVEDVSKISDLLRQPDHRLWLDMENPGPEDFRMLENEFQLHPLAVEDAMVRHQRPKVDQYSDFYFVVFYAVESETSESPPPATATRLGLKETRFHGTGWRRPPGRPQFEPGSLIGILDDYSSENGQQGRTNGHADNQAHTNGRHVLNAEEATPADVDAGERVLLHELSMFMGKNYLITVHEHPIFELNEVARRWYRNVVKIAGEKAQAAAPQGTRPLTNAEAKALKAGDDHEEQPLVGKGPVALTGANKGKGSLRFDSEPDQVDDTYREQSQADVSTDMGILLYSLLDTVVDGYFPVIDSLVDRIEDLEEQIFERFNQGAIQDVFNLKKDMLALRKVLAPERDVLNVLTRRDLPIFEQHTLVYFQDVYDHVVRITDSIDTYRDLLSSALDSYLSMQSNRLNITVQTLTSVSIMLMSISTFTGWFGMNFEHMNELHTSWGYPTLIVVVLVVVGLEALFFKRRGWL